MGLFEFFEEAYEEFSEFRKSGYNNYYGYANQYKRHKKYNSKSNRKKYASPKKPRKRIQVVQCPQPIYTPHHRNLGLKPWASQKDIRAAWKHISVRLHPDKIHDPAQKEVAAQAMILVNDAYDVLNKLGEAKGGNYRYINDWLMDPKINAQERLRRKEDSIPEEAPGCEATVARKPTLWLRDYKTYSECEGDETFLCGDFWVDLGHVVIDKTLPLRASDWIWSLDNEWKIPALVEKKFEKLEFFGDCYQHFTVRLPALSAFNDPLGPEKKWSYFHDMPCAETKLNFDSNDGCVILAWLAIVLFLLRNVLVKLVRRTLVGVEKMLGGTGKSTFSKAMLWTLGWVISLSIWLVLLDVMLILFLKFLASEELVTWFARWF